MDVRYGDETTGKIVSALDVPEPPKPIAHFSKNEENELKRLRAFVFEWSERFGFLAEINPRDSIESIDEVAEMLASRIRRLQGENSKCQE